MTASPRTFQVLVTYGSKRESTAEIARSVADVLRGRGLAVDCLPADLVDNVDKYDAFVVGGALYMNRWHRHARKFVSRFATALRERPVWFFSSGPLDPAAERTIPPVSGVARLMTRVKARGHVTFGGRLALDAHGFIASAMARKNAGDWRDWDRIHVWADQVAHDIAKVPRVESKAVYAPTRWILATLCLLVGISAVVGGFGLALRPDGALLRMPLTYLEHTMFESFLVPGILLSAIVGLGHLLAGWLVLRRSENADLAALVCGTVLMIWIVAQMLLLRTINGMQVGTLVVAAVTIGETLRRLSSRSAVDQRHGVAAQERATTLQPR